jgi:hypothetical protein
VAYFVGHFLGRSKVMGTSRRLFWTALSVLALAGLGCGDNGGGPKVDGGDGGKLDGGGDGPTADGSTADGSTADGSTADGSKADGSTADGSTADGSTADTGADGVKTDGAADGSAADGGSTDAKDGGGTDGPGTVTAPTDLAALVFDRRKTSIRVTWTAPADASGNKVAGYQVRYAKVPITATNFDTATVTTVAPYTGTPAAPGQLDGLTISGLYIENGYYFAVLATDASGNKSPVAATATATIAHFNVTQIPSTSGTNERFGFSVSGDGDLNGDGLSDILVGTSQAGKAYMFLGSQTFGVTAPAVTFSGVSTGFGSSVAQIGDIDNDGRPDIAISDASATGEKVYIYKGRTSWPMALTDVQADYTISTDATYASSFFGFSLARLGDFTGDGVDDFAIGVRGYNTSVGRVVIIPGKTGFGNISLPDTTNSIVIDGDSTLGSSFLGYKVLGLGHFYSISSGTTLVASAPSGASGTPANAGHVYAFHGQTGTAGAISIASADAVITGMAANTKIGIALTDLGTMLSGFPGVGMGNTQDTADVAGANGTGYLSSGTPTTGPFTSPRIVYLTSSPTGGGAIIIGGGLRGRDTELSLIGDATPDLVFGGQGGPGLTISDGAKIGAKTSPIELGAAAEVQITLPANWGGSGEAAGTMVSDVNGDGAADFCIGSLANPGAILVYW